MLQDRNQMKRGPASAPWWVLLAAVLAVAFAGWLLLKREIPIQLLPPQTDLASLQGPREAATPQAKVWRRA
jgi:hypothetical protein